MLALGHLNMTVHMCSQHKPNHGSSVAASGFWIDKMTEEADTDRQSPYRELQLMLVARALAV